MAVKILIADDHGIVRQGLRMILEADGNIEVVGEAGNGREAVAAAEALHPDVVIMDFAMPELNGIEATQQIRSRLPGTRVIMFSMYCTQEHVFRALQAGAQAYIVKESAGDEVIQAIDTVMAGRTFFGKGVDAPAVPYAAERPGALKSPLESLSPREREVLQLVVEGKTSAAIAEVLSLSPKSVETYRSRLMSKLGIGSVADLVKFAIMHGITPPS